MAKLTDDQQSDLMDEAWVVAFGVIMEGKITLQSGEVRKANNQEILSVARDLMNKKAPTVGRALNIDDLKFGRTDGKKE